MKRCYILGAGFSKACGLPLSNELTAHVFDHLHTPEHWVPHEERIDKWCSFVRELYPQCDLKGKWPDFEDLITVLDEWDEYRRDCGGNDRFVSHLRKCLIKRLGSLLCEQANSAYARGELCTVQRFLRKVHDEKSAIVSFNWDLLLEIAAQGLSRKIAYAKRTQEPSVCIAKPHGSLNLVSVTRPKWTRLREPDQIPVGPLDVEWEHGDDLVVRARDPCDAMNTIWRVGESLIVAPTTEKSYESAWIKRQWHLALDMVRNADEIIIIGYSLPPTDVRPRLLLQFARYGRSQSIPISLIDPKGGEIRDRFTQVVDQPIEVIGGRWEDRVFDL